jgi:Domain of unknown function (DUF4391)
MLFAFPPNAEFNRIIPKTKFYEHTSPTPTLKAKFVSQISQVVWSYKLAPETINLPPSEAKQMLTTAVWTPRSSPLASPLECWGRNWLGAHKDRKLSWRW